MSGTKRVGSLLAAASPNAIMLPAAARRLGQPGRVNLQVYLNVIQIIVSVALIVVILLQGKQGSLGGLLGGDSGFYRTRRGIEKTLHNVTIALTVTFFITSLLTVLF